MRKLDLLAELTDVMSDGVAQDLWLSVGVDNNPWGQYQPLIPQNIFVNFIYISERRAKAFLSMTDRLILLTSVYFSLRAVRTEYMKNIENTLGEPRNKNIPFF